MPFITLYGMKMFGVLAGMLIVVSAALALVEPLVFSLGGWFTSLILIGFAYLGRQIGLKEEQRDAR